MLFGNVAMTRAQVLMALISSIDQKVFSSIVLLQITNKVLGMTGVFYNTCNHLILDTGRKRYDNLFQ